MTDSNTEFGAVWLKLPNQDGFRTSEGKWRDTKPHPNMRDQSARVATKGGARIVGYWWPHGLLYRNARDHITLSVGSKLDRHSPLPSFEDGMRLYQKLLAENEGNSNGDD